MKAETVTEKKKTVYCLRLRLDDSEPWSDPYYYRTKARRDKIGAMNRIIGGIRTHSYQERMPLSEIEQLWFE